jgi:hypothetical protein
VRKPGRNVALLPILDEKWDGRCNKCSPTFS